MFDLYFNHATCFENLVISTLVWTIRPYESRHFEIFGVLLYKKVEEVLGYIQQVVNYQGSPKKVLFIKTIFLDETSLWIVWVIVVLPPAQEYLTHMEMSLLWMEDRKMRSPDPTSSMICFFVCLELIILLDNLSLIWRHHHYQWRASNSDLCSALMGIEQWGFFSVPHLL